ncbi:MAG: HEPN domain-containing protein [Nitrospinae bacterium]|nr:HEPN domain-containing protein [Nitrospinota bacterium]
MKPLVKEWVEKAEGDYATARRESRVRKSPNYDAVCFHAQQCVEKYFKAILQDVGARFNKTHNLSALLNLIIAEKPLLESVRSHVILLNEYAVEFRYPGESAEKKMAREAMESCREVRLIVRAALGLGQ